MREHVRGGSPAGQDRGGISATSMHLLYTYRPSLLAPPPSPKGQVTVRIVHTDSNLLLLTGGEYLGGQGAINMPPRYIGYIHQEPFHPRLLTIDTSSKPYATSYTYRIALRARRRLVE